MDHQIRIGRAKDEVWVYCAANGLRDRRPVDWSKCDVVEMSDDEKIGKCIIKNLEKHLDKLRSIDEQEKKQ
jgi:hypothetical protein